MLELFSHQRFSAADLPIVGLLILLEGLLSADNALVLAIMVKHLPKKLQQKALLYGLGGALVFRLVAIVLATHILALWWLQLIGALYLIFVTWKHFAKHDDGELKKGPKVGRGFWPTVVAVELADIAFAIDSVVAGVALVAGNDPAHRDSKLWVVYLGAIIGVVLLRFAAGIFIRLLERFPALDHLAYTLVGWVGVKLLFLAGSSFETTYNAVNPGNHLPIHIPHMSPLIFWSVMALIIAVGVWYASRNKAPAGTDEQTAVDQAADAMPAPQIPAPAMLEDEDSSKR